MDRAKEADLVKRAKNGDHKAFEALIKPIQKNVYSRAVRAAKDLDKADDIAQETMIRAYTKIGTFRGDSRFSTWVYTICSRNILMYFRKERRKGAERLDDVAYPEMESAVGRVITPLPAQDEIAIANQSADSISKAMDMLDPKYYQVIDLWLSGNTLNQISDITNLTAPAAKTRIHRARKQIRGMLQAA